MHPMIWIAGLLAIGALVLGRLLPAKGNPSPLANRLAYQIGSAGSAVLMALMALLAPDWPKALAAAAGALAGLALAWLTEWFEWPQAPVTAGRIGALTIVLIVLSVIWPDPIVLSYALGGLSASLAASHLFAVIYGQTDIGTGGLLGVSLLAVTSLSWLPKLLQNADTPALWLLTLAAAAVGTAAGAYAWPGRPAGAAVLGGGAACLIAGTAPRYASLTLPGHILLPTALGAVLAVGVSLASERDRSQGLGALALSLLAVLAVMVSIRLDGTAGLVFFGAGLIPVLGLRPTDWGTALMTVAGGRAVLQLWLDRTNMTSLGLDLTHAYGYAGLVAGCLFVVIAAIAHQRFQSRRIVLLPLGWGLLLIPVLLGYLLHVEPLGTFITGLLTVALVWGLVRQSDTTTRTAELAPALAGVGLSTALITAPWLVDQLNAARGPRIAVFLVSLALVSAFVVAATRRVPNRAEQMMDAD